MAGWSDVYKIVVAMVPLYVPLILGYGSVKWWHMFNLEQCEAINQMNSYFILPFFTFEFTTRINPFKMNYFFVAGDVISTCFVIAIIFGLTCLYDDNYDWCIINFSMSAINNNLIMGVPVMRAMYGSLGEEFVIQSAVLQVIIWVMILLFMLEIRRVRRLFGSVSDIEMLVEELEENDDVEEVDATMVRPSAWVLVKTVLGKLAKNPSCHACIAGLIWASLVGRWHFEMPSIMEGCITIMSKAGAGTSMFCMGLFMALNEKRFAWNITTFATLLTRFIIGPMSVGFACLVLGLSGKELRIATVQAAFPPAVISFVYAKEYRLYSNVTCTAVIVGTLISLPILIVYYVAMDWLMIDF